MVGESAGADQRWSALARRADPVRYRAAVLACGQQELEAVAEDAHAGKTGGRPAGARRDQDVQLVAQVIGEHRVAPARARLHGDQHVQAVRYRGDGHGVPGPAARHPVGAVIAGHPLRTEPVGRLCEPVPRRSGGLGGLGHIPTVWAVYTT